MKFVVVSFFCLVTCPVIRTGLVAGLYFIRFKLYCICWCISLCSWDGVLKSFIPISSHIYLKHSFSSYLIRIGNLNKLNI